MKLTIVIAAATVLLAASQAFALGPIENGTYVGSSGCWGEHLDRFTIPGEIVVTDSTMLSRSESGFGQHLKTFVVDEHGFFTINPEEENGNGYFTAHGLHFDITIRGIKGEDTFVYSDSKLYMVSSAWMGENRIICEGVYERVEEQDSPD